MIQGSAGLIWRRKFDLALVRLLIFILWPLLALALVAITIISPTLTQFLRFFLLFAETTYTVTQFDLFSSF